MKKHLKIWGFFKTAVARYGQFLFWAITIYSKIWSHCVYYTIAPCKGIQNRYFCCLLVRATFGARSPTYLGTLRKCHSWLPLQKAVDNLAKDMGL